MPGGQGGHVQPLEGPQTGAEQQRRGVHVHLVDETRFDPRGQHTGPAFDHHVFAAPGPPGSLVRGQGGEHRLGLVHRHVQVPPRMGAHGRRRGDRAPTDDDRQRLVLGRGSVRASSCQARIVGQQGAGADDDRIGPSTHPVGVLARRSRGDPPAGAVGRRRTSVEGLGQMRRDPGAALVPHLAPAAGELLGAGMPRRPLDPHTGRAQAGRSPTLVAGGVRHGIDAAADARVDDGLGAGTGAAVMIARLEGDVEGAAGQGDRRQGSVLGTCAAQGLQRRDLGVRGARAGMMADGQDGAVRGGDDRADERGGPAHAAQGRTHGQVHGPCVRFGRRRGECRGARVRVRAGHRGPSGSNVSAAGFSRSFARSHTKKPVKVNSP